MNLQASVSALRDFFPDTQIDYLINRSAECLIAGNPEISTLLPVLSGEPFPVDDDFKAIENALYAGQYDVIFNFCPLFKQTLFGRFKGRVSAVSLLASLVNRNEKSKEEKNHVAYQAHRLVYRLFSALLQPEKKHRFGDVRITLSNSAIEQAETFILENGLNHRRSVVFLNPDTSSGFTRIPLERQISLIRKLADLNRVDTILLGAGHVEKNIEQKILNAVPESLRRKITVVPSSLSIDAYAALIDYCDIYITGDTGPLHIAAARKFAKSGEHTFRNRTAVFSIFGSTPARVYGYDSDDLNYLASSQDAPSRVYIADSPCRNITCINKMAKTCKKVRCFESLDTGTIIQDIRLCLQ